MGEWAKIAYLIKPRPTDRAHSGRFIPVDGRLKDLCRIEAQYNRSIRKLRALSVTRRLDGVRVRITKIPGADYENPAALYLSGNWFMAGRSVPVFVAKHDYHVLGEAASYVPEFADDLTKMIDTSRKTIVFSDRETLRADLERYVAQLPGAALCEDAKGFAVGTDRYRVATTLAEYLSEKQDRIVMLGSVVVAKPGVLLRRIGHLGDQAYRRLMGT